MIILARSLEDAFVHATNGGQMNHSAVVGGEYGLAYFYQSIIEPLLDTLDRADYDELFKILDPFVIRGEKHEERVCPKVRKTQCSEEDVIALALVGSFTNTATEYDTGPRDERVVPEVFATRPKHSASLSGVGPGMPRCTQIELSALLVRREAAKVLRERYDAEETTYEGQPPSKTSEPALRIKKDRKSRSSSGPAAEPNPYSHIWRTVCEIRLQNFFKENCVPLTESTRVPTGPILGLNEILSHTTAEFVPKGTPSRPTRKRKWADAWWSHRLPYYPDDLPVYAASHCCGVFTAASTIIRPTKRQRSLYEHEASLFAHNFNRGDFFVGNSAPVRIDPRLPVCITLLRSGDNVHFDVGNYNRSSLQTADNEPQYFPDDVCDRARGKRGEARWNSRGLAPVALSPESRRGTMGLYLGREKVAIKVVRAFNPSEISLRNRARIEINPESGRIGVPPPGEEHARMAILNRRFSANRFKHECEIWRSLWKMDQGQHVLPLFGFCQEDGPRPYIVSPWQENGTALTYIQNQGDRIDYLKLVKGVARRLQALHSMNPPVVHGGLEASNIVIGVAGNPLIADFGLSRIVQDITGNPCCGVSDSYRWIAPEILTHQQPYSNIKHTTEVMIRLSKGEHPQRPTDPRVIQRGLDYNMWGLLGFCWATEPSQRPTIQEVLRIFLRNPL
ncbi:kinase-like domain-containing protein [Mycena leptocephala]|nr:kinase-like domain-containing protein [Mycena leptocephala]